MNMALIALPSARKQAHPPLTVAYLATLLEQRRHIVRIYDLALEPGSALTPVLSLLRSFRPHVIVVGGEDAELVAAVAEALRDGHSGTVLAVPMSRSGLDAPQVCGSVLRRIMAQTGEDARLDSVTTLDQLPFPARHLLSLERYALRAVGGELQTTLQIGCACNDNGRIILRSPDQIVAEMRSVAQEFGFRHFLIADVPITGDREWLTHYLDCLDEARLGIYWEAPVQLGYLDAELITSMARTGCEALCFQIDAAHVFESAALREQVRREVACARQHGIFSRGEVTLAPPYESIPYLVDVAATFGLDDVRFEVAKIEAVDVGFDAEQLIDIARKMYDRTRDRQRFIERFGPALGNLIWQLRGPRSMASQRFGDKGLTV